MASKKERMTVYAYRLVPHHKKKTAALSDLLDNISRLPLEKRARFVARTEVRLEDVAKQPDGTYLMDFVLFRFGHGPGKASRKKPIEGFPLGKDDAFGEETAVLYDPSLNHLLVQYNHFGVRAGRIAAFLSAIDNVAENNYDLELRFDENIEKKLAKQKIFRKISFKAATLPINRADRNAGKSLTGVLAAGKSFSGEEIEVTITAQKNKPSDGLAGGKVAEAYNWVRQRLNADAESVTHFDVTGKEDVDARQETLHLLGHKLRQEFSDLSLGPDRRVPRKERWDALLRARNGWKRLLKS
ncbi:MAG: DUF6731 family protein [Acidiferrobacterales bacterium]|nr:DUF6731 family protein [Acidiferrobacterales bacterium]